MVATYEAVLVAVTPQQSGPPVYTTICGLKWTKLTVADELSGPGSATVDVVVDSVEQVGKTRLINLAAAPCELWIYRTTSTTASALIFAGPVTACRIQNRTLTISAPGLLAYLNYWLRDTDYAVTATDQATIVQQLCDQWQALDYGNDGIITTGLTATGVVRDLTLSGRDGKFIMPVIVEMGGRENGFDLTVNPATRALTMWSPRKGTDLTNSVFLDRRSIGTPDISWTVAPGVTASEVFASSSSTTGTTLTSIKSTPTLRATFGRSYVTRSYQDISDQSTLDDHATRAAIDVASQSIALAPGLLPVAGFSYGDFTPGDLITYDFDAGLGQQTFTVRVQSVSMTMDSGRETLKVGLL